MMMLWSNSWYALMIPITNLIAIRHGDTHWNRTRHYHDQAAIAFNERGFAQARDIARSPAQTSLAAICTSDPKRAHQTAAEIALAAGMTPQGVAELREQHFGIFQGFTAAEVAQRWPDAGDPWQRHVADFSPPDGETRNAFSHRCVAAINQLARVHVGATISIATRVMKALRTFPALDASSQL